MSFVEDDTGSELHVTCVDNDTNQVIELTGGTVTLSWRDAAGTLVNRPMTIVDAMAGIAKYRFQAGELISPQMRFDVAIQDASGRTISNLELIREDVRAAI